MATAGVAIMAPWRQEAAPPSPSHSRVLTPSSPALGLCPIGASFSLKAKKARRASSGADTQKLRTPEVHRKAWTPLTEDGQQLFAVNRKSVHSTSYSDLLSTSWKPTWTVSVPAGAAINYATGKTGPRNGSKETNSRNGSKEIKKSASAVELSRSRAPVAGKSPVTDTDAPPRRRGVRLPPLEAVPLGKQLTLHRVTGMDCLRGEVEIARDDAWAYQTLNSLQKCIASKDPYVEEEANTPSTTHPESHDGFDLSFSVPNEQVSVDSRRPSLDQPDVKLTAVEGAPSYNEALERLLTGFISEGESTRVRYAFSRFACGEEELDRDVLDQVISHLGCIIVDDDIVTEMADNVTSMSEFELAELLTFLENYMGSEKDTLEAAFKNRASKQDGDIPTISVCQLPLLMKDLQIVVLRRTQQELLQRAHLTGKACLDSDDVVRVLAAYRACEGFTASDLKKAREVFEEAAEKSTGLKEILNTTDLPNALLDFFGVHCIKHLRELVEDAGKAISDPGIRVSPVHFHEFLVWARQLRNAELLTLSDTFENVDAHDEGVISCAELLTFMKQEGFTVSHSESQEFFDAAGLLGTKASFSYDDAVAFLLACRKSEGFSRQDLEELSGAYNKFDTEGEGEITTLQVLDLLRYLGYQVRVEVVEGYAHEVDFNENGTMDINEYLRLMRLHREEELENVHTVFHRSLAFLKAKRLPFANLHQALIECNCCPSHCDVFDELCRESLDPSALDFSYDEFKPLADKSRKTVKQAQKMKANFSDAEFAVLQATFKSYDVRGLGVLDQHQLSLLFYKCGVPLHTADSRHMIMDMLDKARQSALHAELSSEAVGEFGSFSATFMAMIHTWRTIARRIERKKIARLDEARAASSFSLSEVEEFQKVFSIWLKRGLVQDAPPVEPSEPGPSSWGRRMSAPDLKAASAPQESKQAVPETSGVQERVLSLETILGLSKVNEQLTFEDLKKLLGHLKLKLSPTHSFNLQAKLRDITGDSQGSLDISDFLYLMKWMLDTNFAHLNEKAAHVAKSCASSVTTPGADASIDAETDVPCPMDSLHKTSALRRRASV